MPVATPPEHEAAPQDVREARRSLRARLAAGPAWRAAARADLAIYRALRTHGHQPGFESLVRRYSRLGEHAGLWLALGGTGALLDAGRRPAWRRAIRSVAGAYLLNTALKNVVRRKRPVLEDLPALIATPTSLSFPSAHSSSSFAAAQAYGGALLPGAPLYLAAVAMAGSRVYLGVHYPTDIAAGALLGTVLGRLGREPRR